MNFSELTLSPSLQQGIEKLGFAECTPIQELAIPTILQGKDLAGLAQTGTGKTAAFLLPLAERILRSQPIGADVSEEQKELASTRAFKEWRSQNFILIVVPTRELAEQVYDNMTKLCEFSGLRGVTIYGGTGYEKQKEALNNHVEFVVATPGRLIDLYKEHVIDLKQVRCVVFDEADRMFDMGFKDDMKFILQRIPKDRQFLVFSATLNFDVLNTAYQFGADPVEINVSRDQAKAENVKDEIFHLAQEEKPSYLLSLLKKHKPKQTIIFSNFKFSVERIAQYLTQNGVGAMGISSLLTQSQRNRVLDQFREDNEMNILVATDLAARGLDIKGVDLVINYDLPGDPESYVHRIGRTGRAGTEGHAYSLVSDRDVEALERIETYLKHKIAVGWLEETEIIKDAKPFPSERESYDRPRPARTKEFGRRPPGGREPRRRRDGPRDFRKDAQPAHRGEQRPGSAARSGQRQQSAGQKQANGEARPHGPAGHGQKHGPKRSHPAHGKSPRREGSKPRFENKHRNPQRSTSQGAKKPASGKAVPPISLVKKIGSMFKKLFN